MPRSFSCAAIVLRAYDVGEADRFCILLTRERGRITARASGVRRLTSRMGGSLLPLREVQLSLNESRSGIYVSSSAPHPESWSAFTTPKSFAEAHQGVELLLSFVQHEEPLPEIYDATRRFLAQCADESPDALLRYTFRLLSLLGVLPDPDELALPEDSLPLIAFIEESAAGGSPGALSSAERSQLDAIVSRLLRQHLTAPLKSTGVASAMH